MARQIEVGKFGVGREVMMVRLRSSMRMPLVSTKQCGKRTVAEILIPKRVINPAMVTQ